jgi:multiple sugar transport system ATP-binding protein
MRHDTSVFAPLESTVLQHRVARYQNVPRNEKPLLGLRPEHISESKLHPDPGVEARARKSADGSIQIAGARDGGRLRLAVDLNNMHLLNEVIGAVI